MRRPSATGKALGFSPLMKTRWANAPGIKRVPRMTAFTEPAVFLPGRPAALRTPDARAGCVRVSLDIVVWNDDRIVSDGTHVRYYE